jgi:hypothetical protein
MKLHGLEFAKSGGNSANAEMAAGTIEKPAPQPAKPIPEPANCRLTLRSTPPVERPSAFMTTTKNATG